MSDLAASAAAMRAAFAPFAAVGYAVLIDRSRVVGMVHVTVLTGAPIPPVVLDLEVIAALGKARIEVGLPA